MIAIFLAPIYILINIYVIRWTIRWMGTCHKLFQKKSFRIIFITIYIFLATTLLSGFLIKKPLTLHRILKNIGNYFLGTFLYILLVILIVDLIRLFLKKVLKVSWVNSKRVFVTTGFFCMILILSVSFYGIFHAKKIQVTNYQVTVEKEAEDLKHLRVVLVADTHFGYSVGSLQAKRMVKLINNAKPDIVCFAGDIFDNEYDAMQFPDRIQKYLSEIQSTYGVYACWGNHDLNEPILAGFTFGKPENASDYEDARMEAFLEEAGITLLEDESVLIDDKFYLIGRKDYSRSKKMETNRMIPSDLTKDLDKSKTIIFIDHQPRQLEAVAEAGADLDLCGHTHDGQMFPGNLTTSLMWENSYGYLKKGQMHNIVTSGMGVWGPNMRVGTKSEICVIDIGFE